MHMFKGTSMIDRSTFKSRFIIHINIFIMNCRMSTIKPNTENRHFYTRSWPFCKSFSEWALLHLPASCVQRVASSSGSPVQIALLCSFLYLIWNTTDKNPNVNKLSCVISRQPSALSADRGRCRLAFIVKQLPFPVFNLRQGLQVRDVCEV